MQHLSTQNKCSECALQVSLCPWRKEALHQTLVYSCFPHVFFALRLVRLGGRAGGGIADSVFRHGGSLGVHHGLPNNVGHAMLFGSAIDVLLGCLLVDVLGLKRAVRRQTRSRASSATRQRKPSIIQQFSTDQERKSTRRVQYISDPNETAGTCFRDIPSSMQSSIRSR